MTLNEEVDSKYNFGVAKPLLLTFRQEKHKNLEPEQQRKARVSRRHPTEATPNPRESAVSSVSNAAAKDLRAKIDAVFIRLEALSPYSIKKQRGSSWLAL